MSYQSRCRQLLVKHAPRRRLKPCVRTPEKPEPSATRLVPRSPAAPPTSPPTFTDVPTKAGILTTPANDLTPETGVVAFADIS
jgi:hypothetical protein